MKFEMNRYTLNMILTEPGLFKSEAIFERKYSLLDQPVVINTDKPDGIVQLGRDTVDLSYTDNIRGSLESLLYAAKRREGGRVCFGPGGAYSVYSKETPGAVCIVGPGRVGRIMQEELMKSICRETPIGYDGETIKLKNSGAYGSSERTSGRTFRALLNVMNIASASPENSLTVFVVEGENAVYNEYHKLINMTRSVSDENCFHLKTITLPGNRRIRVITKQQSSEITEACQVVYDHTIQEGK